MKKQYYKKNLPVSKQSSVKKIFYHFSSAGKRILVRILDLLFLNSITSFFLLLVLIKHPQTTWQTDWATFLANKPIAYWRFGLFWLLVGIFHFSYFILLVGKTNGYTLFGYGFGLRVINQTDSSDQLSPSFHQLIKKELINLFLIIFLNGLFVVIGGIWLPNDHYLRLTGQIFQSDNQKNLSTTIFLTIFRLLFGTGFFLQIIYFIATIYFSKKTNGQDRISQLAIIDLRTRSVNQKSHQKLKYVQHQKVIQQLPGSGIVE